MKRFILLYVGLAALLWLARGIDRPITGIEPDLAFAIGAPRLWPEPSVVEVVVWPEDTTVGPGESVQFYAALRLSDGTVECSDAGSVSHPPPWTNEAECLEAEALLSSYQPQDTPFVRFSWTAISASRYDSLFYHVLIRTGDSTQFLADIPIRHPAISLDWANGVPNTEYEVQAYARAFFKWANRDTFSSGPAGPWTRFGYPEPYPIPVIMGPVRVDTASGGM